MDAGRRAQITCHCAHCLNLYACILYLFKLYYFEDNFFEMYKMIQNNDKQI